MEKYKISVLCGANDYLVKFKERFDMNKLKSFLSKKFKLGLETESVLRFLNENKIITVFDYGEIIFSGFEIDEVKKICDEIVKELNI